MVAIQQNAKVFGSHGKDRDNLKKNQEEQVM